MMARMLLLVVLAIALPVLWVRRRLWPGWLEALARWDRRAADQALGRGDDAAAISHLNRARGRLDAAIRSVRGSRA